MGDTRQDLQELFRVSTVVPEYDGCRDVHFEWFRTEPRPGFPYWLVIDGYDDDARTEGAIDELFTREEADALKSYLDTYPGLTTIARADLPYPNNIIGQGARAVGGGDDFYSLHRADGYPLAFKVAGYFNLRGCELVEAPGETFRPYLHVVSLDDDGRLDVHQETQLDVRAREDTPTPKELVDWFER
jgi:hypothetical protein